MMIEIREREDVRMYGFYLSDWIEELRSFPALRM